MQHRRESSEGRGSFVNFLFSMKKRKQEEKASRRGNFYTNEVRSLGAVGPACVTSRIISCLLDILKRYLTESAAGLI